MAAGGKDWDVSEVEQVIDLYIRTPFGKIHSRNPDVIAMATKLGRSTGSIALKMSNIASLDETLDRKGMANASNLDRRVWSKFFESLKTQASLLMPEPSAMPSNSFAEEDQEPIVGSMQGTNLPRITNVRQGQQFFREIVVSSYDERCAITGISQSEFLVAGHIRPWATDPENRMNPRNGLCLNRLHDKAFEEGLISISPEGAILYSKKLKPETREKMVRMNDSGQFTPPRRFKPDPIFLEYHRDVRFQT
jgi:putative restriction endonuclease